MIKGRGVPGQFAVDMLFPYVEIVYETLQRIGDVVHAILQLHHTAILLGRWNVLVLAIKVVLPAELTRPGLIALLLARTAMVARLSGSDLLSSHLLGCGVCAIWRHVGPVRVRAHGRLTIMWSLR